MTITFQPKGVCSKSMEIDVSDGIVRAVKIVGGCQGNLQGISKLVEGMPVDEVIARLEGISCGFKKTSCPDQLALALKSAKRKEAAGR